MDAPSSHINVSVANTFSTLRPISLTGLFGGDSAVAAMGTVHLFAHRWICGWYNTPGSYEIAKRYGQLANVWFWDGLFPGGTHDPSELFKLSGMKGPPFLGAHSGSKYSHTGHLAYLLARKARDMEPTFTHPAGDSQSRTVPASVTIFDLRAAKLPAGKDLSPYLQRGGLVNASLGVLFVELVAAAISWLGGDGLCASIICLGIAANGIACLVLGWGTLAFHSHAPAEGAPPGDGILCNDDGVLILLGGEPVISSILRGRFFVRYSWPTLPSPTFVTQAREALARHAQYRGYIRLSSDTNSDGSMAEAQLDSSSSAIRMSRSSQDDATPRNAFERPSSHLVTCCSFLFMAQFITQLLLIPLCTPLGQGIYIFTLALSWIYNAALASHNREDIQTKILLDMLGIADVRICKVRCDFRTRMAVFAASVLNAHSRAADPKPPASSQPFLPYSTGSPHTYLPDPIKVLNGIVPNDTKVWRDWKARVVETIESSQQQVECGESSNGVDSTAQAAAVSPNSSFITEEGSFPHRLHGYADSGLTLYKEWHDWCKNL